MSSYLQTFRRHRRLLSAPVVLAVVLALWAVLGSPKAYESASSLWIDTPPPAPSSVGDTDPAVRPPAEQEQLVLQELLKTRDFQMAVARRGPLARYLATNSGQGWGPTSLLSRGGTLESRVTAALGPKRVLMTVAGPQVLQVHYRGATPEVAAGTLRALIDEFNQERTRLSSLRGRGTADYYRGQVDAASKAVADAHKALADFTSSHPGVGRSDPNLKALERARTGAESQLAAATASLNQATSAVTGSAPNVAALEVIDAPRVPVGATSGHKKTVLALVGGLFAGCLISLLGVVALTPGRPEGYGDAPGLAAVPAPNGAGPAAAAPSSVAPVPPPGRGPLVMAVPSVGMQELRGWIVDVHDDGWRRTRPVWTVRQPVGSPAELDEGASVRTLDPAGGEGVVRRREQAEDGGAVLEVELTTPRFDGDGTAGAGAMDATDARWLGREIAFVGAVRQAADDGASS